MGGILLVLPVASHVDSMNNDFYKPIFVFTSLILVLDTILFFAFFYIYHGGTFVSILFIINLFT